MKSKNLIWCKRIFIFMLIPAILSMGGLAFAGEGGEKSLRTVRIGVSEFPSFSEIHKDGSYSGIIFDYLDQIVKYTGWKIEIVTGSPEKMIEDLKNGEVDIMGAMIKNTETEEFYDFAELSSGYSYSTLTAKKDNKKYVTNDYDSVNGMKVGIYTKAISRIEAFEAYCKSNSIHVVPVYYNDSEKWDKALDCGEVDAVLTSSIKLKDDERIILSFQKEPYYFATTKGKVEIMRELNLALAQIWQINSQFDENIYRKYFDKDSKNELVLTEGEKQFIKDNPVLKYTTSSNWKPISYFDKKTGKVYGINADILALLNKKTGIRFEFVPSEDFQSALGLLESGKIEMVAGICDAGTVSKKHKITLSQPYLPTQTVILQKRATRLKDIENPVLATLNGCDYSQNFENCTVKLYDTFDECAGAVKSGEVDFTAGSGMVIEEYIREKGKNDFLIIPLPNADVKLSFAFSKPADSVLVSIMDKAIYSVTDGEKQSLIFKNASAENTPATLKTVIYANPTRSILIILFIGVVVLVLLYLIMRMRLKLLQKALLNGEAYRIVSELTDEHIFEYDYQNEQLKLPEDFAKLTGQNKVVGKNMAGNDEIHALIDAFRKNRKSEKFSEEFKCKLADGTDNRFRAVCAVLHDAEGEPVRSIGKITNIQADFDEKRALEKLANTDSLTGIYNKNYCETFVKDYFEKEWNHKKKAALCIIDLDNFKQVNEVFGHLGGDEVLKYFAGVLKDNFHNQGILGRWGGDEFFVFISRVDDIRKLEEDAKKLCNYMDTVYYYEDVAFELSISVGIALSDGVPGFHEFFRNADRALYEVKRSTKNDYKLYNSL